MRNRPHSSCFFAPLTSIVIGGQAHGERFDPDKIGPVLRVPKRERLSTYVLTDGDMPAAVTSTALEYHLHQFNTPDGFGGHTKYRLWMSEHVQPHEAMAYLINTALRAPVE